MVRLKVAKIVKLIKKHLIISIPYGAIKRFLSNNFHQKIYQISIPYGAIKSFYKKNGIDTKKNFNSLWCD